MQTINPMFIKCCNQSLQRTGKIWGALEYNYVLTPQLPQMLSIILFDDIGFHR